MTSAAPFRDQFAFVRQFEQHIGVALVLLDEYEGRHSRDMMGAARGYAEHAEISERARRSWQGIWQQLEQARDLARNAGRIVHDPDDVFTAAGIWRVDGPMTRQPDMALGNRRILKSVTMRSGNLARMAIARLSAAVPEAIVAAPPSMTIPPGNFVFWLLLALFLGIPTLIGLCTP